MKKQVLGFGRVVGVVIGLVAVGWLSVAGCAEQKAAPVPSQRQVQSDSDRFFDKMKQDERDHGAGPQGEK